jgi:hypothetical protein
VVRKGDYTESRAEYGEGLCEDRFEGPTRLRRRPPRRRCRAGAPSRGDPRRSRCYTARTPRGLVAGERHGHSLLHRRPYQVARGGPTKVVRMRPGQPAWTRAFPPGLVEAPFRDPRAAPSGPSCSREQYIASEPTVPSPQPLRKRLLSCEDAPKFPHKPGHSTLTEHDRITQASHRRRNHTRRRQRTTRVYTRLIA